MLLPESGTGSVSGKSISVRQLLATQDFHEFGSFAISKLLKRLALSLDSGTERSVATGSFEESEIL